MCQKQMVDRNANGIVDVHVNNLRIRPVTQPLAQRCAELALELGLAPDGQVEKVTPLTGGVASDIARVDLAGGPVVVKFALPKLKVAEDWRAPVHRNRAEYAWLTVAAQVAPDNAPRLFGRSDRLHGFAMEYLAGDEVFLWKQALLQGRPPQAEAARVGDLLGRLHAASTASGFDRGPFDNSDDFHALRLEPYLLFTASRHPDLAERLNGLAQAQYVARQVLVHGDVSPKNILLRDGAPILLDAECATMGDPSFDVSFCLNHLLLKAVHVPVLRDPLWKEAAALWKAYVPHVTWEDPAALGARVAALLPALFLARVDGKSPVEYLTAEGAERVRSVARPLVANPPACLGDLIETVRTKLSAR